MIWIDTIPEYFNSLAEKTPEEFEHFLISHGPNFRYNTKSLQANSISGQHCLMYSYILNVWDIPFKII